MLFYMLNVVLYMYRGKWNKPESSVYWVESLNIMHFSGGRHVTLILERRCFCLGKVTLQYVVNYGSNIAALIVPCSLISLLT